jgi:hypothetical protein
MATRSNHGCNGKGKRDDARPGGGEDARRRQNTNATENEAGTTHLLEVERKHEGSDYGCD